MTSTTSSNARNASSGNQTTNKDGTTDDQQYTFEDIKRYTRCEWLGNFGWIMDKGDHLHPSVPTTEHLYIEYKNENGERDNVKLRKELVNKYLRNREKLWVDFGDVLYPECNLNNNSDSNSDS